MSAFSSQIKLLLLLFLFFWSKASGAYYVLLIGSILSWVRD
jgi:hypothetical protein